MKRQSSLRTLVLLITAGILILLYFKGAVSGQERLHELPLIWAGSDVCLFLCMAHSSHNRDVQQLPKAALIIGLIIIATLAFFIIVNLKREHAVRQGSS